MTIRGLIFIAAPIALLHLAVRPAQVNPVWRTDYAAACKEAEQSGKPLMVVFR